MLPFAAVKTDIHGWTGVDLTATGMLTTALFKTGHFIVIELAVMNKIIQEQGLSLTDAIDVNTAVEAGKVLGM